MVTLTFQVRDAWRHFVGTGEIDSAVRPEIARSWERCRNAGIDPTVKCPLVRLGDLELERIRRTHSAYIETALPFMRFLESIVRGTDFILVLTDAEGTVMELFGDRQVVQRASQNGYVPGCSRSEMTVGTNAIGLALAEKKAVQLSGAEHYNQHFHGWTCSSAPIHGPSGEMLGCVTLSGKIESAQLHTLGMVVATAEAIQNRLRERSTEVARVRDEQLMLRLLRTSNQAIITLNPEGEILYVNRPAAALLGRDESTFCGRKAADLFGTPGLEHIPTRDADGSPVEMVFESRGQRKALIGRTYVVTDEDQVLGAILEVTGPDESPRNFPAALDFRARFRLEDVIGEDEGLRRQLDLARKVAPFDCRILITGETGTGKELLVQGIHNASRRARGSFVAINCAALPKDLIEAELFGYKEGAFTSARRGGQIGKIELANGGTLFLDEIGQMPYDMQAKLLRVLQDGIVTRLGDSKPIPVDVRIIAATNEDLFEKSQQGGFRSDLYFRLSAVELCLPPLRERGKDIQLLIQTFLRRLRERLDLKQIQVQPSAMEILGRYHWPGNIREMENVLEMAAITSQNGLIGIDNLPARLKSRAGRESRTSSLDAPPDPPLLTTSQTGSIREVEADVIRQALNQHHGKISLVSRELGISRSTIYRRMREIGINRVYSVDGLR